MREQQVVDAVMEQLMAYIVERPNARPFFQSGAFRGWEERNPRETLGEITTVFKGGHRELLAREIPEALVLAQRAKLADVFISRDGIYIVSARLKSVLEEMDGDAHQFFPLKLLWRNGDPVEGAWFAMNVHAHQASIIDEKSVVRPGSQYAEINAPVMFLAGYRKPVTLDGSKLSSSLSLWREERYPSILLASDRLIDRLKADGIKFFSVRKATVE